MKISCLQADLEKAVTVAGRAVPTRTTMPILECIIIKAGEGIRLLSTDMELGIDTGLPGEVEEKGGIALSARLFSEIVRKLVGRVVRIETDENLRATIRCGKSVYTLAGLSTDEFPDLPEVSAERSLSLSQFALREAIRQTIFSISTNENTRIMTGELFEAKDGRFRIIALDGHRIALRYVPIEGIGEDFKAVIPGKALSELAKVLSGDKEEEAKVSFSGKHAFFEFGETVLSTRLIEGNFFNVDQMVTDDYETKVSVDRKELLETMDSAVPLISDAERKPIILNITDSGMNVSIKTTRGHMNTDVEITKEGKDLLIGFNPHLVMDALKAVDDEEVTIFMMGPRAPMTMKDADGTYLYIVLPINFSPADV